MRAPSCLDVQGVRFIRCKRLASCNAAHRMSSNCCTTEIRSSQRWMNRRFGFACLYHITLLHRVDWWSAPFVDLGRHNDKAIACDDFHLRRVVEVSQAHPCGSTMSEGQEGKDG